MATKDIPNRNIPKINPDDVSIDNIGDFEVDTEDTLNDILREDIPLLENKLNELKNFYKIKRRIFSKTKPSGIEGLVWFHIYN